MSGRTGSPVGRPVKYNVVGVGNLIGPQVYITTNGAVYILFGFGKMQGYFLLLFPTGICDGVFLVRQAESSGTPDTSLPRAF